MSALFPNRSVTRLPVGSLIAVAPPGAGKTTLLRAQLAQAGLTEDRIVCRDDLRARYGSTCRDLSHRAVPASCMHNEDTVTGDAAAAANSHLVAGHTWLYDQTGCKEQFLRVEIERAHAQGLAAVALRRSGNDGAPDVSLDFCLGNNAARARRVPNDVIARMWDAYRGLSIERLYALGFDLVVTWNEHTTFELMPEGPDARNVTADLAIVGDIHGCAETFLDRLLPALGTDRNLSNPDVVIVSAGDINDKGQHSVEMIRWWLWALRTGRALMVHSNHNKSLLRGLTRPDFPRRGGLVATLAEIEAQPDAEQLKADIIASFSRLPSHLVFRDHVVAHAAMTEDRLFRTDAKTASFAIYTRYEKTPWEWTGTQTLLHGHVVVDAPTRRRAPADPARPGHIPGDVIAIDTGAYHGGGLTAYLSATGQTVTVPSAPGDQIAADDEAAMQAELVEAGILPAAGAA